MLQKNPRHAGAVSRQMVMTIALVVAIAATLAFLWSQLSGPPEPPRIVKMAFQCVVCGEQQEITNEEFQQRPVHPEVLSADRSRTNDNIDCPKCGQKHSAMLMTRCLSCKQNFLASKVNLRILPPGEVPPVPVCPHCGTDQGEYRRKHLGND